MISDYNIQIDPAKIAIIRNWKIPLIKKEVQSFLGFYNFYRRFIQVYGHISRPLNRLTGKDKPSKLELNEKQLDTFR